MFGHRSRLHDPILPRHILVAAGVVVLGAWLRFRGMQGDLWLDEIWSLNLAATLNAWHEAFWKLINDNNHPLNTVWLFFAGEDRAPWVYRLASISAGTLTVIAVGWALARDGAGRMLTAMLLTAVLYPLVNFGSEARGYGLMILFVILAFVAVDRARDHAGPNRWLFGLAVLLAAGSHLSSLALVFMMCVAYAWREWRAGRTLWDAVKQTLWFAAPAALALAVIGAGIGYGFGHLRQSWYGGRATLCPPEGCFVAAWDELVHTSTGGLGEVLPGLPSGVFAILVVGMILGLFVARNGRAYLYTAVFVGVPLIYFALGQPNVPYGRYFIGVYAFVPLLIADALGEVKQRSRSVRVVMGLALLALVGANAWGLKMFFQYGRGDHKGAVEAIENATAAFPVRLAADMPFRVQTVYAHFQTAPVTFTPPQDIAREKPEWLVTVLNTPAHMPKRLCFQENASTAVVYELVGTYAKWGMSGTDWGVYRLALSVPEGPC